MKLIFLKIQFEIKNTIDSDIQSNCAFSLVQFSEYSLVNSQNFSSLQTWFFFFFHFDFNLQYNLVQFYIISSHFSSNSVNFLLSNFLCTFYKFFLPTVVLFSLPVFISIWIVQSNCAFSCVISIPIHWIFSYQIVKFFLSTVVFFSDLNLQWNLVEFIVQFCISTCHLNSNLVNFLVKFFIAFTNFLLQISFFISCFHFDLNLQRNLVEFCISSWHLNSNWVNFLLKNCDILFIFCKCFSYKCAVFSCFSPL